MDNRFIFLYHLYGVPHDGMTQQAMSSGALVVPVQACRLGALENPGP